MSNDKIHIKDTYGSGSISSPGWDCRIFRAQGVKITDLCYENVEKEQELDR